MLTSIVSVSLAILSTCDSCFHRNNNRREQPFVNNISISTESHKEHNIQDIIEEAIRDNMSHDGYDSDTEIDVNIRIRTETHPHINVMKKAIFIEDIPQNKRDKNGNK